MQSKATTVEAYLKDLPEDRRRTVDAVRAVILKNLDKDYEEGMQYGMIGYFVPHSRYPDGYHCDPKQPLLFAGLASQKQSVSLYLMGLYICADGRGENELGRWFRDAWTKTGKRLDMGAACVRFKTLDDVPLEIVGEAIRRMPAHEYIRVYEATLARGTSGKSKPTAAKKSPKAATQSKPRASKVAARSPAKKKAAKRASR